MLGVITEEGLAHHCSTLVHTSRLVHILGLVFSFLVEKLVPLSGHVRDQLYVIVMFADVLVSKGMACIHYKIDNHRTNCHISRMRWFCLKNGPIDY
ncbi:hypothetical protein ACSQ67_022466 [Phaseolus vulgaris]